MSDTKVDPNCLNYRKCCYLCEDLHSPPSQAPAGLGTQNPSYTTAAVKCGNQTHYYTAEHIYGMVKVQRSMTMNPVIYFTDSGLPGLQSIATSRECKQSEDTSEPLEQEISVDSEPEHLTLFNQISPVADP